MKKAPYKIGIDGRCLVGNRTGVGRYLIEICRYFDELLSDCEFYIYSNNPFEFPIESPRWKFRVESNSFWKRAKKIPWLKFRLGKLCAADDIDLFWGPMHFIPKLGPEVKVVLTVHDFFYLYSSTIMSMNHRMAHKFWQPKDLKSANRVVVNSLTTGKRLEEFFGIKDYSVAAPGLSETFQKSSQERIQQLREKHRLEKPFFLSVATWNPRKNIESAILSFLEVRKSQPFQDHELVLVGDKGWNHKNLNVYTQPPYSECIKTLGYVDDEDLAVLYSATEAFLFPSFYEGFGIPVLEARACGAKVIATDIPELREAGGDSAIYVSPDVQGMIQGFAQLKSSRPPPAPISDLYSWKASARTMTKIFKEMLDT